MNINKVKNKHILTICAILIVIIICSIAIAYRNNKRFMNESNNAYNMAFYELVESMGDVENYLAKSLVTSDAAHSAETLTYIWKDAALAQVYLSQIPISNEGLSNTQRFLNQVSEYSYTLSRKSIKD